MAELDSRRRRRKGEKEAGCLVTSAIIGGSRFIISSHYIFPHGLVLVRLCFLSCFVSCIFVRADGRIAALSYYLPTYAGFWRLFYSFLFASVFFFSFSSRNYYYPHLRTPRAQIFFLFLVYTSTLRHIDTLGRRCSMFRERLGFFILESWMHGWAAGRQASGV